MATILRAALLVLLPAAAARAGIATEVIEYKDGETVLQGYLAYDDAQEGKRPGVLVVHEWWGHDAYARGRAEQLAALGYVAFALDMYGKGIVTGDPKEAGSLAGPFRGDPDLTRRRAKAGLAVLRAHARTDPDRVAAIGYCFGGTVALELARSGETLAAVVSFHGSLRTKRPADAATLKARVLVCNGADDGFVPAEELAAFTEEMRKAKADYQIVHYAGAVHSFTNPASDKHGIPGVGYNAAADRRSWAHMKLHLAEAFAR